MPKILPPAIPGTNINIYYAFSESHTAASPTAELMSRAKNLRVVRVALNRGPQRVVSFVAEDGKIPARRLVLGVAREYYGRRLKGLVAA